MNKPWFAAIALICSLCACKKAAFDTALPVKQTQQASPVTVILGQNLPGYTIPHIFEGLSYETALLTESPDYLNENNAVLIQLIKNLGKGVLRIGGNSSDEIEWGGDDAGTDSLKRKLTKADIDRLAAFAKAIKWPVLFGLNLADNNAVKAAAEADYVHTALQNNLYALQFGNEPDVFFMKPRPHNYKYADYQREWDTYYAAVKSTVPGVRFAGPDIDPFNTRWLAEFAKNEAQKVILLDAHYYNYGPASDPSLNINNVLRPNKNMEVFLQGMNKIATAHNLPFRISEANSIWGQGKPGLSNTFASALWALDFMWRIAQNNGQGVNFHGGGIRFVYTPINIDNGLITARPVYYAMLAFKYGAIGGKIIPVQIINRDESDNYNVYACVKPDKSTSLTLINKEIKKDFSFTVQLSNTTSSIKIVRLSAPSVTALNNITFAGSTINADGTFEPAITEQYRTDQKNIVVTVPAGSAAVVVIK
ncbi:glycosyl hydrolase family protein [Mucilaginibacter xinganensis]|uniref:Beta-glucuronidase C-terminal domain-containing protein n=1 Tax=Mucilaginibacter xinganensis TaxID=1234841 RepID=A0A223NR73_9SPHI|nr:glycosyl hydrolase family protein [Mucilaginibacter xinganensis]ASU32296.1 hypothetical protein MuYL_0393 [Mucilaginibacter xinganensis]